MRCRLSDTLLSRESAELRITCAAGVLFLLLVMIYVAFESRFVFGAMFPRCAVTAVGLEHEGCEKG